MTLLSLCLTSSLTGAQQWCATTALGNYWVGFIGVDAEIFDGFGYDAGLDFAVLLEFVEGGQGDEAVVDLEEFA
jgi:hypothetical protein